MKTLLILVLASLAMSCGSDVANQPWQVDEDGYVEPEPQPEPELPEPQPEPEPEPEPEPMDGVDEWAGIWLVDQPNHALYEATIYDFRASGELVEIRSEFLGADGRFGEVGFVSQCIERVTETADTRCEEWGPTCFFGDRWGAPDARTLHIEGDCEDGVERTIELGFERTFDTPSTIIVDGETWEHNWFDWRWMRCDNAEDCGLSF